MFTGITVSVGEVASIRKKHGVTELAVIDHVVSKDAQIGDSVSINGICLTVVKKEMDKMYFDVSEESQRSSGAGELRPGSKVNLEPAMPAGGRFGGHFVTGHVDGTGIIESMRLTGAGDGGVIEIKVKAPPGIQKYIVKKGSIALDGVSLTVADVHGGGFSVVIIPHTSGVTALGAKNRGDSINIETDIIGKYVERFVGAYSGDAAVNDGTLLNKLREEGFAR